MKGSGATPRSGSGRFQCRCQVTFREVLVSKLTISDKHSGSRNFAYSSSITDINECSRRLKSNFELACHFSIQFSPSVVLQPQPIPNPWQGSGGVLVRLATNQIPWRSHLFEDGIWRQSTEQGRFVIRGMCGWILLGWWGMRTSKLQPF